MEPILSKLQEGVKYPRFERDVTKTINDLVDHITKERGIYSSSIEPNPNEHKIWFNTNDNKLYIHIDGEWNITSGDRSFNINTNRNYINSYPTINIFYESYTGNDYLLQDSVYIIVISTSNIERELYNIARYDSSYYYLNTVKGGGVFVIYAYYGYIYINKISEQQTFENIICKSDNDVEIIIVNNNGIIDTYNYDYNQVVTKNMIEDDFNMELSYDYNFLINAHSYDTLILGEMKDLGTNFGLVGNADEVDIYSYGNNIIFCGDYEDALTENIPCHFETINIHIGCAGKGETLIHDPIDVSNKYIADLNIYTGHGRSVNIGDTILGYTEYLNFIAIDNPKYRYDFVKEYRCFLNITSNNIEIRIHNYINFTNGKINYKGNGSLNFYNIFISSNINDFELEFNADFYNIKQIIADVYVEKENLENFNFTNLINQCNDNRIHLYTTSNKFENYINTHNGYSEIVTKSQTQDDTHVYITYRNSKGSIVESITLPI
jgi:hypothetical protein